MRPWPSLPPSVRLQPVVLALLLCACSGDSDLVYVPVAPPQVELSVSASSVEVAVGDVVVLRAQRRYRAEWKQVSRRSLAQDQCWLPRPPPDVEPEVADNLTWQASEPAAARFNTSPRPDRAREVVFSEPGEYVLRSRSVVWCGPPAGVRASDLVIRVRPA